MRLFIQTFLYPVLILRGDHPSKNHPISKLCEYIRKHGWPVPQWDLINEKIIQQRKNKHGNANIMLYTYKVS